MKAVRLTELGGPEKLHIADVAQPEPGPGGILVRIKRAAFNRRDVFITQNLYPGIVLPRTLGSDGCGEVAALGPDVSGPPVGTPVVIDPQIGWDDDPATLNKNGSILGMPQDGTFAQYVVVPAANVYAKPSGLSDDEAAALPLAGLTAYRATFTRGRITKDDVVLVPGVGSGVQTFVLLYAVHVGAKVVVTSGSDEKLERAKKLGAAAGINYKTTPEWFKEARKLTDGGPSLIVDSTGGETLSRCHRHRTARRARRDLRRNARRREDTAVLDLLEASRRARHLDGQSVRLRRRCSRSSKAALKPVVDRTFAMDDVGRSRRVPAQRRAVRQGRPRDRLKATRASRRVRTPRSS
jgi:zinc-binding alcohol dehydrogenase/oxidoreductase